MKVEDGGHLCLHRCDLNPTLDADPDFNHDRDMEAAIEMNLLHAFKQDARIAASYALAAGFRVTYAAPGVLCELSRPEATTDPKQNSKGDTETFLLATVDQCDELITALRAAKRQAVQHGEAAYARVVLEQAGYDGPWRLIVGVLPPDGPNASE